MEKLATCLWFDGQAEEAAQFYTSIFRNSKIGDIAYYGDAGPGVKGTAMTVAFEIEGWEFLALNGGPEFKFTNAISLVVYCKTQEEVDDYWAKLLKGGTEQQCGWVTDRFGLSWQVTPTILPEMLMDKDLAKRDRVMKAMMKMVKLDIAALEQAYDG
jgi:predicted 3-demethylubiquinone-9 3-methyltransferase (glyoxalase superfamily)